MGFDPEADVEEASFDTPFSTDSVFYLPEAGALVAVADHNCSVFVSFPLST